MKRVYGLVAISISSFRAPGAAACTRGISAAAKPYATLAQVMRGIPFPNSNIIFDTQSTDPAAAQKPAGSRCRRVSTVQQCLRRMAGGRERRAGACRRPATSSDPRSHV